MVPVRAWTVGRPGPIDSGPLDYVERPEPEPGPGEVRVRERACGVCRTDLHLAEGDLAPRRPGITPGHEVVGVVDDRGPGATRFAPGDRIGIAWLRGTCGRCRWCRSGRENLCRDARFTGWDADGGYAEYAVVPEAFAYRLPPALGDGEAAPLLCAGIVGYRALKRAELPPGGRADPLGEGPRARLAAGCGVGRACGRGAARAARRRGPVRACRGPGTGRAPGARPGRHARRRRHPPHRRPWPRVRRGVVPGEAAAQR